MLYKLLDFPIFGDYEGNLVPIESGTHTPFPIQRVYYIWGTIRNLVRGSHAHRTVEQIAIAIRGSCDFILTDGKSKEKIHLTNPNQGLFIPTYVWGEFTNFSSDCVVLVLASGKYDENEYIRDWDTFIREAAARRGTSS